MSFVRLGAALVAAAAVGASASAGTVFSQPGGSSGGQDIGFASTVNGIHSGGGRQRVGDDFSLATSSTIASMTFWGWSDSMWSTFFLGSRAATENLASFRIEIFKLNGAGNTPGDSLLDETIGIGDVSIQSDGSVWKYTVTFANAVALDANTAYGISVAANLIVTTGPWGFVWENAAEANNQVFGDLGFGWQIFNTGTRDNMAFELHDAPPIVPLPAPVFLALAGLAGALPMRRKLLGVFQA